MKKIMNKKSNLKQAVVTFTCKTAKKVSSSLIRLKTPLFDIFYIELIVYI